MLDIKQQIAERFGVSVVNIRLLLKGRNWKDNSVELTFCGMIVRAVFSLAKEIDEEILRINYQFPSLPIDFFKISSAIYEHRILCKGTKDQAHEVSDKFS